MRSILVTGAAGFIGFHLSAMLLDRGFCVIGVDNLNDYYDPVLKEARLERLDAKRSFRFLRADVSDRKAMARLFSDNRFEDVVHLAAQAGVRYSLKNPHAYIDANITGMLNILEGCRSHPVHHLLFASSSSVYGLNRRMPFSTGDNVDHPASIYAATKKSCELMAHAYAHLYGIPCSGLRFFTVYGPWGRPDMALFLFTKAILEGRPIDVYNNGKMQRDFTYVDDIVEGIVDLLDHPPVPDPDWSGETPDPASSSAPYRLYNIGNNSPVKLLAFVEAIERELGKKADKRLLPLQAGDVPATWADVSGLERVTGYRPATPVEVGIKRFIAWYREYYGV